MIVNLRESLNTRDRKSVNENSKYYDLVNLYESCNLSADNKKTLAKMINNNASDKAIYSFLYECYEGKEDIKEDTVKKDNKWVNKGKEGTHGEFKTKKAADAQRKAMFANGYKGESLKESTSIYRDYNGIMGNPGDTWTIKELKAYWETNHNSDPVLNEYKSMQSWLNDTIAMLHNASKSIKEAMNDPRYYKMVEYDYDGDSASNYLGHVRVRTNSDKVALRAAEKYAMSKHPEDNPGHFKIVDDNYTNVDVVDSDGDYLTTLESLESEDGWSEEILDIVDPFFVEVEKVAYELRNTVRGAYRFGTTVKDLVQVFRGFSETADDIANELDDNQEHLEEDWRTGTFTKDDLPGYRAEMKKRVESVVYSIHAMKRNHPDMADLFDKLTAELVDILSSSYMNESLKESISIKEEPHEECVGNNCTDENDLFPEEKYFTIVVTRSDDGEDEIIDDVTKEIADKYIDDLKRDNDEFFSHAKVLDHNGEVVNSWEYLEEAAKSKKSSSIKDRLKKLIPDLDI